MKRTLTLLVALIPIAASALPRAPAVRWDEEVLAGTVVAPTIHNRDYQRVRIDTLIACIRYLYEPKQAIILPNGTDPYFFFAYNDAQSHITTVLFNESQMMDPASWIIPDVLDSWCWSGSLRYVSPSAYCDGSGWYPQVTWNCYPPTCTGFIYDEGGVGAGIWTNPIDVSGVTYDYYLPLTETGPDNTVYMSGWARDTAEDSRPFKSFNGATGDLIDPPGEVLIFPSSPAWGPDPVYMNFLQNTQVLLGSGRVVVCTGGFRTDQFGDPTNPLLVAHRESSDGGLSWSATSWLDQETVPDMPGSIPGIAGHYASSFFDGLIDRDGRLHFLMVIADSGWFDNSSYIHGLYDIHETGSDWVATQLTDGVYPWFDPRAVLGGDSWLHSPSLALAADGTIIAAWNDLTDTATVGVELRTYVGIALSHSYDGGWTWSEPIKVAGEVGVDEYFSRLVPTTTWVSGADSGHAYVLTMPTGGSDGPLDMIRVPYPAAPGVEVMASIAGGQLQLVWSPANQASAYWVYGASGLPWFVPGMSPGYAHRVAVVAPPATTWSSANGIGDPDANWTYLVMAVTTTEQVLAISNRVGEQDYGCDIP